MRKKNRLAKVQLRAVNSPYPWRRANPHRESPVFEMASVSRAATTLHKEMRIMAENRDTQRLGLWASGETEGSHHPRRDLLREPRPTRFRAGAGTTSEHRHLRGRRPGYGTSPFKSHLA